MMEKIEILKQAFQENIFLSLIVVFFGILTIIKSFWFILRMMFFSLFVILIYYIFFI